MIVIQTVGGPVFVDNYSIDAVSGNLTGTKKAKTGSTAKVMVPAKSIIAIEEWEKGVDVDAGSSF